MICNTVSHTVCTTLSSMRRVLRFAGRNRVPIPEPLNPLITAIVIVNKINNMNSKKIKSKVLAVIKLKQ